MDENGGPATLNAIANSRATTGMFGAGYLEMLAREMTFDLRAQPEALGAGQSVPLVSKGVSFGTLSRTRRKLGHLPGRGPGGAEPGDLRPRRAAEPDLRPWHQAGAVISLRQFTNNAFNHHHGIQSDRALRRRHRPRRRRLRRRDDPGRRHGGLGLAGDPGGARAGDPPLPAARGRGAVGERRFEEIGCASCHLPALPLTEWGGSTTSRTRTTRRATADAETPELLKVNLNSGVLPGPRLRDDANGITWVPAYTDMKLHDITSGPDDPNRESLDMHSAPAQPEFFGGTPAS